MVGKNELAVELTLYEIRRHYTIAEENCPITRIEYENGIGPEYDTRILITFKDRQTVELYQKIGESEIYQRLLDSQLEVISENC